MIPDYALDDRSLLARCSEETMRSSGPGGQHAQRTDSAVRLRHGGSGVEATCQDHREQARNREQALRRLRLRLACHQRGCSDAAWLEPYRKGARLMIGAHGTHYHLVVACVLDALAAAGASLSIAASTCGTSSSQLVRLLSADPEALSAANALRLAVGLHPLHPR